jgi:DNA-binding NarL/FixJ family response regulator
VVDLDLPEGGGLELLEELREAAPGVAVLGITANGDRGLRARALGAGAGEVLVLSASGEEIVAAARRLWG